MIKCPICNSKTFEYESWHEDMGTVEQHGYCDRCGYYVEQAYSLPISGIYPPRRRGYKNKWNGKYYAKNIRKRMRLKKKLGLKYKNEDVIFARYF